MTTLCGCQNPSVTELQRELDGPETVNFAFLHVFGPSGRPVPTVVVIIIVRQKSFRPPFSKGGGVKGEEPLRFSLLSPPPPP